MSRIYWDSMLFIYALENHPAYARRLSTINAKMRERGDTLCTSVFTVGEVLTGFYKRSEDALADRVRRSLRSPHVELLPFNAETADRFARIRANSRVSPADAIHLASAATEGVDLFLTNDRDLHGIHIDGIHFIAGLDAGVL